MKREMNKKGADIAIGTIVLIILALVVLVVIIYGFTVGWGNLFQNIIGYGGGKVNVQSVIQSCQLACSTRGVYDYCQKQRSIVFNESKGASDTIKTCKQLDDDSTFGVSLECLEITCPETPPIEQPGASKPLATPPPTSPPAS